MYAEEQVRAGMAKLTEYFGSDEWKSRINLDELDMGSSNECLLGQLFKSYGNGLGELDIEWDGPEASSFGFYRVSHLSEETFALVAEHEGEGHLHEKYGKLTETWKTLLSE